MRAVNLLPQEHSSGRSREESLPMLIGTIAVVLVVAALAAEFMMTTSTIASEQRAYNDARQQLAATPPPPPARSQTETSLAADQSSRVLALSVALSRRVAWDRIFRELSLLLPQDVWLTSLNAKSPASGQTNQSPIAPTPAATANGLTLQGYTYSHDSVARLLSRLEVIPDLTNVQLARSQLSVLQGHQVVQFTVSADVRLPGSG